MKALKHLAAACAVLVLLTSCSALTRTATKLASATTIGNSTGSALSSIFSVLKSAGVIDLSNLTNIINLGRILTGAGTLANANNAFTNDFASGLINGSSNLINNANVSGVISGLKKLAAIDNAPLLQAASSANTGIATPLSAQTPGVSETLSTLTSIYNRVK